MMSKAQADHLSVKDKQERNVLHIALINENICMVQAILQRKFNECYQKDKLAALVDDYIRDTTHLLKGDAEGMTLLHFALVSELFYLAIYLIEEYGFDIGKIDTRNNWNAFHYCAHIRFADKNSIPKEYEDLLCCMMSKAQANHLPAKDRQGVNVMDIALTSGNFLLACYILEKEYNEQDGSASMRTNYIEDSTRLRVANVEGMTLLHFAIALGRYNLAIFLIERYGFDVVENDTKNGWNAFHYCAHIHFADKSSIPKEYEDLLCLMMSNVHADFLLSTKDRNVLHVALIKENICMARVILQKKFKGCKQNDKLAARVDGYIRDTTHLLKGDAKGMTLLHFAIKSELYDLATFLIKEYEYDVGKTSTKNGWNAFRYCAHIRFIDKNSIPKEYEDLLCHMMSRQHVDLHLSTKDKQGRNALQAALFYENICMVRAILQRKFNECYQKDQLAALVDDYIRDTTDLLEGDEEEMTLLHFAIESELYDLAVFLIGEYGYDIGKTNTKNGWNAFHYCAHIHFADKNSIPKEYKDLLSHMMSEEHADHLSAKDKQDRNVLHVALFYENICMVRAILQMKFNECYQKDQLAALVDDYIRDTTDLLDGDGEGMTLLHFAIESELYDLAVFLIEEYGYVIGKIVIKNGWNAFHYCAHVCLVYKNFTPKEYKDLLRDMMSNYHAYHLSVKDKQDRNVLHVALINETICTARAILQNKLEECNQKDQLPARVDDYIREINILINGFTEGMTLLHFAIKLKLYDLAILLVEEYGYDIGKIVIQNGWNAFHYCAHIPFPETSRNRQARMNLLEHMMTKDQTNRYMSVRDNQGKNVLHHAIMNRHFWIAKCILQRKLKICTTEDRPSAVSRFLSSAGLIGTKQYSDFLEKDLKGDEEFWKATLIQTFENHKIGNI